MGGQRWLRGGVAVGSVAILVVAAGWWYRQAHDPGPVAEGRPGDACPAEGPAGIVGLDVDSGAVRWTNVVGGDVQVVWTPEAGAGTDGHVNVVASDARVRSVAVDDGSVVRCLDGSAMPPDEALTAPPVDGSGATARNHGLGAVDLIEADGTTVRWQAKRAQLVGASTGGVVVRRDLQDIGIEGNPADPSAEVLEPATGSLRWHAAVAAVDTAVTPDHLVALECDACGSRYGSDAVSRVTAYDLADGSRSWDVDLDGPVYDLFATGGLVLVSTGDEGTTLLAIDEATGEERWTAELPEPGRGGAFTGGSGVVGAAEADGTVAVAVVTNAPYRD